jgi:hypothetical protein
MADVRVTSSDAPADVVPALGDEHMVPGLEWGEVRDRMRAVVGVDAAHPIRTAFLRLRVRSGTVTEQIADWTSSEWVSGAQLGALWRSPVASVEWGFGVNTRGNRRFDISVGRQF